MLIPFIALLLGACATTVEPVRVLPDIKVVKEYSLLKGRVIDSTDIFSGLVQVNIKIKENPEDIPCFINAITSTNVESQRIELTLSESVCKGRVEQVRGYVIDEGFEAKGVPFECEDDQCRFSLRDVHVVILGESRIAQDILDQTSDSELSLSEKNTAGDSTN